MDDLTEAAMTLRALPPSCGPVRLVAIDGHAGSGKSTLAVRLAAALGGAPVVRLDDLATHDAFFDWTRRLADDVLEPLSRGVTARYAPYDWTLRRFRTPRAVLPATVVLVEGVGAGRAAVRPWLARLLWMDRSAEDSWQRGRERDGVGLSVFWDAWTRAETRHFAADPSRPFADVLVREWQEGYKWLPGTRATARQDRPVTHGDRPFPPY